MYTIYIYIYIYIYVYIYIYTYIILFSTANTIFHTSMSGIATGETYSCWSGSATEGTRTPASTAPPRVGEREIEILKTVGG